MDDLIDHNAGGDINHPGNVITAGIIAAEEAVKAGAIKGELWDECGAHLLAAHFAYFKGVSLGTFIAPALGQRLQEMQSRNGSTDPAAHVCGVSGCEGVDCASQPGGRPEGCGFHEHPRN
jgi:hypothetical protein